ncbi:MAG: DUF4230 domain-containing protein [Chthoniobacterales bacterium]
MQLSTDRPSSKRLGLPFALALIVLILALLTAFVFYRIETLPARGLQELERVAQHAADAFGKIAHLQPKVTVNNRVYLEQTTTIAQLAVKERQVEVEHELMHTWAGSTKRIRLHGTFAVKAGFDLHRQFSVHVTPTEVLIELPHAEILSVEQRQVEVLALENGYWNKISPDDISHELATLPDLARARAGGLPAQAEAAFTGQILEQFHPPQPVRAIFPAPSPAG